MLLYGGSGPNLHQNCVYSLFFSNFFAFWGYSSVNWICFITHQPFSLHETKNQAKIPIQLDFIDCQSMAEFCLLLILSTIECTLVHLGGVLKTIWSANSFLNVIEWVHVSKYLSPFFHSAWSCYSYFCLGLRVSAFDRMFSRTFRVFLWIWASAFDQMFSRSVRNSHLQQGCPRKRIIFGLHRKIHRLH